MSFAVDLPLLIDFVAARGDDFGLERQVAARNADAIELQLQISLAPEVAGILGCFEMADEIAAARKSLLTELGDSAQVTKNGVPDVDRGRGEIRLVEGTLQKSAGGQDNIPCAGAQAQRKNNEA